MTTTQELYTFDHLRTSTVPTYVIEALRELAQEFDQAESETQTARTQRDIENARNAMAMIGIQFNVWVKQLNKFSI